MADRGTQQGRAQVQAVSLQHEGQMQRFSQPACRQGGSMLQPSQHNECTLTAAGPGCDITLPWACHCVPAVPQLPHWCSSAQNSVAKVCCRKGTSASALLQRNAVSPPALIDFLSRCSAGLVNAEHRGAAPALIRSRTPCTECRVHGAISGTECALLAQIGSEVETMST